MNPNIILYEGWTFEVYPARRAFAEECLHPESPQEEINQWDEDYPDGLIEPVREGETPEGWGIDLVLKDMSTSIAYPEDEILFSSAEEAREFIRSGDAYRSAMRSQLGDNLEHFRSIR